MNNSLSYKAFSPLGGKNTKHFLVYLLKLFSSLKVFFLKIFFKDNFGVLSSAIECVFLGIIHHLNTPSTYYIKKIN